MADEDPFRTKCQEGIPEAESQADVVKYRLTPHKRDSPLWRHRGASLLEKEEKTLATISLVHRTLLLLFYLLLLLLYLIVQCSFELSSHE